MIQWALEEHMRPTAMILRTNPYKKWNDYDFILVQAYKLWKAELCPSCGSPRYLCQNNHREIQFKVEAFDCKATVAIDKRKKADSDKDGNLPVGREYVATPYSTENTPLVDYRYGFYKDLAQQQEKLDQLNAI